MPSETTQKIIMGRPSKNNCEYFPHFTTMRNHKKIKALRSKFGQVLGYAFWSMFVEYLTEQDGCELEFSEIELEMFAGELGVSVTEIRDMINYCFKIELLFLDEKTFIYSDSLNENLKPVFDKRKTAKEISATKKRRSDGTFTNDSTTTSGVSVTEKPQSKVDDSKVDDSKEQISPSKLKYDRSEETLLQKELLNSDVWHEDVCRKLKNDKNIYLIPNELKDKIPEFMLSLSAKSKYPITLNSAKEYFSNWIPFNLSNVNPKVLDHAFGTSVKDRK